MTTKEAGLILHVSAQRVCVLIRSGRLKAERHGWGWWIEPEALEAVRVRVPGKPRKSREGTA